MRLADRVSADDQRNRLLVVHRHAGERSTDVPGCRARVRVAVGAFRIHIDQTHVIGTEGPVDLPLAAVALVSKPGVLGPPKDLVRLPDVGSSEAEAEGLEPHRLVGNVAGEDQQVGPGDLSGRTSA